MSTGTSPFPTAETPDRDGAYPRLGDDQIALLARDGDRRRTEAGEVLFREGQRPYDFCVVLDGTVAVVADDGDDDEVIAVHGPRRFLGELSLLTGQAALFTAVVVEPGEVLVVPAPRLRELVSEDAALGDLVLRAYLLRREILIGLGAGFKIVGSRYSPDTRRLREFAARNRLPHRFIDIEEDAHAEALLRHVGVAADETPVVIWHGDVLRNPSNAALARVIGLPAPSTGADVCELLVVGTGPSGLAASVYGASDGLTTVALEAVATGGQAGTSSRIENYLGFPSGLSGAELADRATIQARKFGVRLALPARASAVEVHRDHYVVRIAEGEEVHARTLVIATGARYRKLPVPRLEEFEGDSVFYAATLMEARVCAGDPVVVVGGGNSAGQAAVFLAGHAAHVRMLVRDGELTHSMSRYLIDRVQRSPRIDVLSHTEVRELLGDEHHGLQGVVAENNQTGERAHVPARAMFVFIGAEPHTGWLGDCVALDEHGFVVTGPAAAAADPTSGDGWGRPPMLLETSQPGILAVGDVRSGSVKRVASAVGEGAMAVRLVHEHLEQSHRA